MRRPVHYLESTDSIRSHWDSSAVSAAGGDEAHAQLFIETLLSIAFGRDVAIQQSFAFDSYAFQKVLVDLRAAHDIAAIQPDLLPAVETAPVMLHLHKVDSFAEAVASILRRMANGSPKAGPFFSSLYPDLHNRQELLAIANDVQQGSIGGFVRLLGDVRAPLFENLWSWFGDAARSSQDRRIKVLELKPASEKAPIGLEGMLSPLLNPSSPLLKALEKRGYWDRAEIQGVIRALRELQREAGVPNPFKDRSLLYGQWKWHGAGESAESIVGPEAIGLVREVVSTLYNQVTVDSMSLDTASFSTPMGRPGAALRELPVQQLALWSRDAASGHDPFSTVETNGAHAGPQLEVHMDITDQKAQKFAATALKPKKDTQRPLMREAFEAVLQIRTEPKWQASVDRMLAAVDRGEKSAADDALNAHVALIADALAGKCVLRRDDSGRVRIALPMGAAALAGTTEYLTATINPWLAIVAAGLAAGVIPAKQKIEQRVVSNKARTSLGQLVYCREVRR